jgi:hypothetical protein
VNAERARRIGLNEALFRQVNEQVEEVNARFGHVGQLTVICECGYGECMASIEVPTAEYERVRSDPLHFIVLAGHEIPDVEVVVENGDGWNVVEKCEGPPAEVSRQTDPRS